MNLKQISLFRQMLAQSVDEKNAERTQRLQRHRGQKHNATARRRQTNEMLIDDFAAFAVTTLYHSVVAQLIQSGSDCPAAHMELRTQFMFTRQPPFPTSERNCFPDRHRRLGDKRDFFGQPSHELGEPPKTTFRKGANGGCANRSSHTPRPAFPATACGHGRRHR